MCLLAWFTLFPVGRQFVADKHSRFLQKSTKIKQVLDQKVSNQSFQLFHVIFSAIGELKRKAEHHHLLLLLCLCMLALPVLFSIAIGHRNLLDGFKDIAYKENTHIAGVLAGEQLVAPRPLPPEAFTTAEVMLVRPTLVSASRNWELLDSTYRQKLLTVFKIMEDQYGYKMTLIEGYRSPQRQNELAQLGKHVTNARAFQSYHQYGKAADCAFFKDGKLVISERSEWAMHGYELYGEVAKSVGLTWGGDWKMMDLGHTELGS